MLSDFNTEGAGGGEDPAKPPIYVPAAELEGDAAFEDRKQYYEGSGINFQKYNDIKFSVSLIKLYRIIHRHYINSTVCNIGNR